MRILAPLALIALIVAIIVVASNSGYSGGGSSGTSTSARPSATSTNNAQAPRTTHRRRYTVKAGDTLGAIAEKTGVSVTTLEDLNPGLDPTQLVAGQKLKLRE
jgi:LysM repeat protein